MHSHRLVQFHETYVETHMSKSFLSRRIDVCISISKLNKDGCLGVIRLLQNVLPLGDLNQFITKIFMDCSNNWTSDQITQLENEMKQTLSNQKYLQSPKNKSITNTNKHIKFPLLRLPIDLITQTSLYFNEADIFKFERCCRLFYQMINNTSYLNLSNNFKLFLISNKRLNQMSQTQYSFFKYCKTRNVLLDCVSSWCLSSDKEQIEDYATNLRWEWENAKIVSKNDGWLENMFRSVETLSLNVDGMFLLDKLPIELLFDPNESHLNEMSFSHYWNQSDERYLKEYIENFEREYLNIQDKLGKQGKEMRSLTNATHYDFDTGSEGPSYISVQHLHIISDVHHKQIDLKRNWLSQHYHPNLRKLTCEENVSFENINMINVKQLQQRRLTLENRENDMNIDTLRLTRFHDDSSCDICTNQTVITTLNLQNSLKNLMLNINLTDMDDENLNQWHNAIESIVKKKYFYKLENAIILLSVPSNGVDAIFKMFEKNVQLLNYQFEKLIIGLYVDYSHCHVFEWNKEIDKQYLDKMKSLCKQKNPYEDKEVQNQMREKFSSLNDEWSA